MATKLNVTSHQKRLETLRDEANERLGQLERDYDALAEVGTDVGSGDDEGGSESDGTGVLAAGPVRMDVERHVVSVGGGDIALPLKEFDLLEYLMRNSGRVLTRGQLIDRVWGADYVGDTKTLDVHVKRLRSKIEPNPSTPDRIVTIRGLGYKYERR